VGENTTTAGDVLALPELLDGQEAGHLTVDERRQVIEQVPQAAQG